MNLIGVNAIAANFTEANLRDSYWSQVRAPGAVFERAKLLRFRAAECDFTGASCCRADFSDRIDAEPKYQEFAAGEFEKIYGPTFGVEVLFDPDSNIAAIGEMVDILHRRWAEAGHEEFFCFEELRVRKDAVTAFWRTDPEAVDEVARCFQDGLTDFVVALGVPQSAQTDAIVRLGAGNLAGRLGQPVRMLQLRQFETTSE